MRSYTIAFFKSNRIEFRNFSALQVLIVLVFYITLLCNAHVMQFEEKRQRKVPASLDVVKINKIDEVELQRLKHSIMDALGLTQIPDTSKMNVSQEEYTRVYGLYVSRQEEKRIRRMTENLNTVQMEPVQKFFTYNHEESKIPNPLRKRRNFHNYLYFPINITHNASLPETVEIDHATLRLLIPGVKSDTIEDTSSPLTATVRIYRISGTSKKLMSKRTINLSENHPKWNDFDIKSAFEESLANGVDLHIELKCSECERLNMRLLEHNNEAVVNSLLVFDTEHPDALHRSKRATRSGVHVKRKRTGMAGCYGKRCCKHSMTVTFNDLQELSYIVQPKTFDAGYCKGNCPFRHLPAHKHAFIQSIIWKKDRSVPKLCCVPSVLDDMDVVHLDEHNPRMLKIVNWPKMKVVNCACS